MLEDSSSNAAASPATSVTPNASADIRKLTPRPRINGPA